MGRAEESEGGLETHLWREGGEEGKMGVGGKEEESELEREFGGCPKGKGTRRHFLEDNFVMSL